MKNRRPRKLKKQLKKRYAKAVALRIFQCALTTAGHAFQSAAVAAQIGQPMHVKALQSASIAIDCSEALANIMKTGPQNWREA